MALVGKAEVERHLRSGQAVLQHFAGAGQAALLQPGMGWQSGGLAEHPGEVERRQVDCCRQRFQ
ncbi:hypothetical protein D3C76_1480010 [compost metagenome]